MEIEELEKRLEWLDAERQKANLEVKKLSDRIIDLESLVQDQNKTISSLEKEIKGVAASTGRISTFDAVIDQMKVDFQKQVTDVEKKHSLLIKTIEKQQKDSESTLNKRINEMQTILPMVTEIKKGFQNRIDEESRLSQRIDSLTTYFDDAKSSFNVVTSENKRVTDDLQLFNKRLADLQVEATTLRKRLDDERNRNDLNIESFQKIETNMKQLMAAEVERKQAQLAFMDKVSLGQVERENTFKAWEQQIASVSNLGSDFDQKMSALEATHKAIKQSQIELDEINIRFDRRINELTEMHRLNEDRFRQEWISFKGDDQKRWTNYQLTQEEQQQEDTRKLVKLNERITQIDDEIQDVKEKTTLINEEIEKQLKAFYSVFHDVIESYEQTFNK
jgi:chromosome segregation ATPase